MAPRSNWKGYLRVSLVSCPVRLHPATTTAERISFHQLAPKTKARIRLQPVDPTTGEAVERSELLRGYPIDKDRYVILEDEELEKIQIESSRVIDVTGFVDRDAVDEIYVDSPYYLAPDGPMADETFRVIAEAMRLEGKAGVARLVLSSRERPVLLTPRGKGLLVRTLRAQEEVRRDTAYFEDIGEGPLDAEMIELARSIIRQRSVAFDPGMFVDRYQAALRELVEKKMRGEAVTAPELREPAQVIDLMEALKRSLATGKPPAPSKRGRGTAAKPARRRVRSGGEG